MLRILGVMTGTSCDGLDAACIEISAHGWSPLWSESTPYPKKLRDRVLKAQLPGFKADAKTWLELNRDLGDWFATSLRKFVIKHRAGNTPHVISNHGQTIAHFPSKQISLQMGDPARIARETGITVVTSFREGDLAAGGLGAPLVPLFHQLLALHLNETKSGIAIHNLGGMSNLTYLSPKGEVLAFDTGPGNVWIDAAAELATRGRLRMDAGGKMARRGKIDIHGVNKVLSYPYFRKSPPKSTGRNELTLMLLKTCTRAQGFDLVATATAVTVESVARAYESFVIDRRRPLSAIYVCGGGARNPTLMDWLSQRLPQTKICSLSDAGFDGQLVEAQAFAYFGYLALMGKTIGGAWTGARGFGPPAHLIPGENWLEVMSRLHGSRSRK